MGAKQGTVYYEPGEDFGTGNGGLGSSNAATLSALYPDSTVINQSIPQLEDPGSLNSAMRAWYDENVLHLAQDQNSLFGSVDMTYATLAESLGDVSAVAVGGEGKPATPYVPNPASPGIGNGANPAMQPASGYDPASSGMGSTEGPQNTSATQGSFALTNLPTAGYSPGSS